MDGQGGLSDTGHAGQDHDLGRRLTVVRRQYRVERRDLSRAATEPDDVPG